jgi:hypothetical protein
LRQAGCAGGVGRRDLFVHDAPESAHVRNTLRRYHFCNNFDTCQSNRLPAPLLPQTPSEQGRRAFEAKRVLPMEVVPGG